MEDQPKVASDSKKAKVSSISERKRNANRQNARRSTGPRSAAGKGRSRWNATKHGLLAKEVPAIYGPYFSEDPDAFESLMKALVDHLAPVGPVEGMLVELIARCYWRQRRIQRAENAQIRLALMEEDHRKHELDAAPKKKKMLPIPRQSFSKRGRVSTG